MDTKNVCMSDNGARRFGMQCEQCDEIITAKTVCYCLADGCGTFFCTDCAEDNLHVCSVCHNVVCDEHWHEGGDDMTEFETGFGSSMCIECASAEGA